MSKRTKFNQGVATVEFAIFATMLFIMAAVLYDLTTQVGKGQALAKVGGAAARELKKVSGSDADEEAEEEQLKEALDNAQEMAKDLLFPHSKNPSNDLTWNMIVHIIERQGDDLVITQSSSVNKAFKTRFSPPTGVISNLGEQNLSPEIMNDGQTLVAVEIFYKVEMLTGLDKFLQWDDYTELYDVAYY